MLGTLANLFRMLSPSSVKQIPDRSSLQLQLLRRMSQIWLPVDNKSTDKSTELRVWCDSLPDLGMHCMSLMQFENTYL